MRSKESMEHTRLLVLSLLAEQDMYGYQMILELGERSDQTFVMKEGTLYPILKGLEKDGYVKAYEQRTEAGRLRKYYHLTDAGLRQLNTETQAWRRYEKAINAVIERAAYGTGSV